MATHLSVALIAAVFLAITALEGQRPLRRAVEPKLRRIIRNGTVGGISFALLTLLQAPILVPVTEWKIGLLHLVDLPRALEILIAVLFLDYTLWIWHWMNHMIPFLWRFHLVHHVDRDLDASTALRFHFGELILSVAFRALQIVVIGADAYALWIWQTILFVSILFHHSNIRLPERAEEWIVRFVVTPRMHGIHHADVREYANSNWSSILTVWDVLHRTLRLDLPQDEVVIGVPAYDEPRDVTIGKVLLIPFRRQRNDWEN